MDTVKTLYELKNVQQHYDGRKVLNIDNLKIDKNQIVGFFGPNGSGKSTLFSLLSFVCKPTSGQILFKKIDSKKIDLETRQSVVIFPQNPYLLKRSVFDNVAYGLKLRNDKKDLDKRVEEVLLQVGLESSFMQRKWSQLSGGEAQRVALAARLILKPKVLILDEPTSGVDTNSAQLIKEAILLAKQKWNTTLFISSHDHNWLNQVCDKRVALFQGEIVESGSVNLLFAPWEKNSDGNLVKVFMDGQRLVIPDSEQKKRDSVMMINSDHISVGAENCRHQKDQTILSAEVSSLYQQHSEDALLVEFLVGGVTLNSRLPRRDVHKLNLIPGNKIDISIDTKEVCWI